MVSSSETARRSLHGVRRPRRAGSLRLRNCMIFVAFVVMAGAAALAGLSPALFSNRSLATARQPASDASSTATIAQSETRFCKRLTFDDTGRGFWELMPCDGESVHDARGQPVPIGTIHRLDAISKSFFGR
jgi:hypothetical protein